MGRGPFVCRRSLGFLRGRGETGDAGRLDLQLVDRSVTPRRGDVVVSWGSSDDRPYVAGIPIGRVESVYSSPRELSTRAVIAPFVDFSSLDLVGLVVNPDTHSGRPLGQGVSRSRHDQAVRRGREISAMRHGSTGRHKLEGVVPRHAGRRYHSHHSVLAGSEKRPKLLASIKNPTPSTRASRRQQT